MYSKIQNSFSLKITSSSITAKLNGYINKHGIILTYIVILKLHDKEMLKTPDS